jgi:hypothetical protein
MQTFKRSLLSALAVVTFTASSQATITLILQGRVFTDQLGAPIPGNTLMQLVNLGGNGVFDPIDLADGSISGLNQWVSGDDSVINVQFLNEGALELSSPTTAGFDLLFGNSDTPGVLSRGMDIADNAVPVGTKFGLRWFPGLAPQNLNSITLAAGQPYGEFTRQSPEVTRPNTSLWLWLGNGVNDSVDGLHTTTGVTPDSPSEGQATLTVVPEPTSLSLAFLGAIGVFALRRRR